MQEGIESLKAEVRREISRLNSQVEYLYNKIQKDGGVNEELKKWIRDACIGKVETLHKNLLDEVNRSCLFRIDTPFLGQDIEGLKRKVSDILLRISEGELVREKRWQNDLLLAIRDYHMGVEIFLRNIREKILKGRSYEKRRLI